MAGLFTRLAQRAMGEMPVARARPVSPYEGRGSELGGAEAFGEMDAETAVPTPESSAPVLPQRRAAAAQAVAAPETSVVGAPAAAPVVAAPSSARPSPAVRPTAAASLAFLLFGPSQSVPGTTAAPRPLPAEPVRRVGRTASLPHFPVPSPPAATPSPLATPAAPIGAAPAPSRSAPRRTPDAPGAVTVHAGGTTGRSPSPATVARPAPVAPPPAAAAEPPSRAAPAGGVEVVIGRIEVKLPEPAAPSAPRVSAARARLPSLGDYLATRR